MGRNGERVANTPIRVLPPRRGGRTVGDQVSRTAPENCHTSQMWLKSSSPRTASGVAVLRGEDDLAPQAVHQPALARDAKLGGERRVDVGDDIQGHCFCGSFFHDNLLLP